MNTAEGADHLKDLSGSDNKFTKNNNTAITESNIGTKPREGKNVVERKRKEKIKMLVGQLKEMLPADFLPAIKRPMPHNLVLETVVSYIKHLKDQNEQLLQNKGSKVQGEEIKRLKCELNAVTKERDTYEKMVKSAALLPQVDRTQGTNTDTTPLPQSLPQPITTSAGRLPGQGLIITQNGQAYYVNEQGVPVAQGVAPPQFLTDSLISKSLVTTGCSSSVTTTVTTVGTSDTADSSLHSTAAGQTSNTQTKMSVATAVSASSVCNGLVAVPGHTGQLPSAIILPNGQVIPVVTSTTTAPATGSGASSTSTVSTTLTSTASSSLEVTSTTTSLSSNLMLLGQQPAMSNIVLSSNQLQPVDNMNQLGRRIMPKPQVLTSFPTNMNVMTPVSLTPLPAPTCSVSAAPDLPLPAKKKRTRKKKAKCVEKPSMEDILATATASLFSPKKHTASDNTSLPQKENVLIDETSTSLTPASNIDKLTSASTGLASTVDAASGAKRAPKRKTKLSKTSKEKATTSPKKSKTSPTANSDWNTQEKCVTSASYDKNVQLKTTAEATHAIEFDPNELDMVLDQVEGNISANSEPKEAQLTSLDKDNSYQVLDEGTDIGHIFSTAADTEPDTPLIPPVSAEPEKEETAEHNQSNYSLSDSYLIGNLTKTAEPVDHRWAGESSVTVTKTTEGTDSSFKTKPPIIPQPKSISPSAIIKAPSPCVSTSSSDSNSQSIRATDVNQYFGKYFHQGHKKPVAVDSQETTFRKSGSKRDIEGANTFSRELRQDSCSSHNTSSLPSSSPIHRTSSNSPVISASSLHNPVQGPNTIDHGQLGMKSSKETHLNDFLKPSNVQHSTIMAVAGSTKPAWSPARESERNASNVSRSVPSLSSDASIQPGTACADPHWQSQDKSYHHTGYSSHPANSHSRPSSRNSVSQTQSMHAIMPWNNGQHPYHPYQRQQQPQIQQQPSATLILPATEASTHHGAAFSTQRNMREPSQHVENSHSAHQDRSSDCNQIGVSPKSHAFSTESLLNKTTDRRIQPPTQPSADRRFLPPASVNNQTHYDKSYVSSHSSNVPFNVNLFTSPSHSQSFSAFKRQSNFNSGTYNPNLEQNSPFTFSLTRSTDSVISSTYATYQQSMPRYAKSTEQHSLLPPQSHNSTSPTSSFHSSLNQSDPGKPAAFGQTGQQQLFQKPTAREQPQASTADMSKSGKLKKQRMKPTSQPAIPDKVAVNRQPVVPFHQPANDFGNSSDIFNSQRIAGSINSPFSLPFQSGFPSMQQHSSTAFPSHSNSIGPSPRFNINNIFKDAPIDSFRFSNPAHSNTMYSAAPHFYPNPMGISNILGSRHTGIDMNRSTHLGGFSGTHSGFHGFHPTIDFPLADQSNPNGA